MRYIFIGQQFHNEPLTANIYWAVAVFLLALPSYILYSRFLTARQARRLAEANRASTATPPGT